MDEYSIRLPRRQEQPCRQTVMESQPELLHYFSSLTPPNKTKENLYVVNKKMYSSSKHNFTALKNQKTRTLKHSTISIDLPLVYVIPDRNQAQLIRKLLMVF